MSFMTINHDLGQMTLTQAGVSRGMRVGNYVEGVLYVHVLALSGTNPRLTLRWETSYQGNYGTGGRYITYRAFATSIRATGLSVLTLLNFGGWSRGSAGLWRRSESAGMPACGEVRADDTRHPEQLTARLAAQVKGRGRRRHRRR
jgi:hypothetical protein